MLNDFGYLDAIIGNLRKVKTEQAANIEAAGKLMADAVADDRLIHVYGGGGHTTLVMGEMFFRAGGLANIDPVMETGLSVFNQALKYLELERTENYGSAIMRYYGLRPGDLLIIFHNIGINAATIDAALEAKKAGAKIIAVSSSHWQSEMPADHFIRHRLYQFITLTPPTLELLQLFEKTVCLPKANPTNSRGRFSIPLPHHAKQMKFRFANGSKTSCRA